ncbi:hypothetical protein NO995_10285 [Aestuariibaculum sp. M13]|uniref:hypothetical protein n=1 Tax=Aestuariibaculum sp. M13 TaxID=2967132 RepID=UPI002159DA83|nr:hypothetical protein [Aestuariibaculum sp. M13]MCR8668071.1 hypothetical protein [Aestuariibaculum sp. M13]
MKNDISSLLIAIIILLSFWILIVKYILHPLFFKPKIKTSEITNFLNEKECSLVEYKSLNKKERERNIFNKPKGLTFESFISGHSEYKIIGFSQKTNHYKIFWTDLESSFLPFGKRILNFIEEKNSELLNELQKEYTQEIINVFDRCPACQTLLFNNSKKCPVCGLNFIAK